MIDELDKTLLLRFLRNCRTSYRELARELGVTCPTVKRRVDNLIESGVIETFTIDLSQETLGLGWAYAEVTTDHSDDRARLADEICSHAYTHEMFAVGSKKYVIFAELPLPDGMYEYGRFLRGLDGVRTIELFPAQQLPTTQLGSDCKYSTRGKRVSFSDSELEVMKYLAQDARVSLLEISERAGYRPKRVRRILRRLQSSQGVHLTIRVNPSASDCVSFLLKITFEELRSPGEIVYWLEENYPLEHWMSFLLSSTPVLVNYMTSANLANVERIIGELNQIPFIRDVETMIIYHLERPCGDGPPIPVGSVFEPVFSSL